jgi:hypothetical protein
MGHPGHGGRETIGILPGARVVCLLALDSETEAYVIAALPDPVSNVNKAPLDTMQQAGGSTAYTERMLYDLLFSKNQPFTFAHAGTPVDQQPGEWSMLNDLGGGLGLERFAAWLRASEFCSVNADALTDTLRVMARTLMTQTVSSAELDTILGGSPVRVSTRAMFESEAYGLAEGKPAGAFVPGGKPPVGVSPGSGESAALDVVRKPDHPEVEIRLAARVVEAEGGNLGGAHRHSVVPTFLAGQHFGGGTPLLHEFRGLDGVYHVESMRGLHLWKTAGMAPPASDSAEISGVGGPSAVYVADPFVLDEKLYGDMGTALLAYEFHAFLANAGSASAAASAETSAPLPQTDTQWQPMPGGAEIVVAPGQPPVRFYNVSAGISIMPDGYVVITDGWGGQIVMGGGNMVLSCPGDIYRLPGRNDVVLAPGDAIVRAKHDVDISSSRGNVRVKADTNLSMLAGNSGAGGVLIESKGVNVANAELGAKSMHTGIAMKSAGDIVQTATGGIQRNAGQLADFASVETSRIDSIDIVTTSMLVGTEKNKYLFSESMMLIPADIIAQGNMHLKGRTRFGGWVYIETEGLFSVNAVVAKGGLLTSGVSQASSDKIEDPFDRKNRLPGETAENPSTVRDVINAREAKALESVLKYDVKAWKVYNDGIGKRYANLAAMTFSFRFDGEYFGRKAGVGFTLPAAMWQQRLDAAGGSAGWYEPGVGTGPLTTTAPYPGLEAWTGTGNDGDKHGLVLLVTPVYHDPVTQAYKPAGEAPTISTLNKPFVEYVNPTP